MNATLAIDTTGVIRMWSRDAEALLGYSESEAVGQSIELIIPPHLRGRHHAGFGRYVQTGVSHLPGSRDIARGAQDRHDREGADFGPASLRREPKDRCRGSRDECATCRRRVIVQRSGAARLSFPAFFAAALPPSFCLAGFAAAFFAAASSAAWRIARA